MPGPEEMSRDELLVVVERQAGQLAEQAEQLAARDRQIAGMAGQLAELMEANEALAAKLARLEHLLSRNSGNSSSPPSRDDDPGKPPAPEKTRRGRSGPARARGKQPGAPGSHLAWTDDPHERRDGVPDRSLRLRPGPGRRRGSGCGRLLPAARDPAGGGADHPVRPARGGVWRVRAPHTAARPEGARPGPVGYGPNLAAFAVYLMVVHFVPAHRVVALLESLTGTAPSVGFVHGLLARTAGLLGAVHDRIRTLITLAYAVCCDETPLKVGPRTPKPGKKKAERYLLVACTELYTHYLLGDRSLDTFKAFVLTERAQRGAMVVHDRYQNYDWAEFAGLVHQLCCQHLLRDLDDAAQVYPDAIWPGQISRALRELIHQANLARDAGDDQIDPRSATR